MLHHSLLRSLHLQPSTTIHTDEPTTGGKVEAWLPHRECMHFVNSFQRQGACFLFTLNQAAVMGTTRGGRRLQTAFMDVYLGVP